MIKIKALGIDNVSPFWNHSTNKKPVMGNHMLITNNPFPNIVMSAKKDSGKTTAAIYLILKHFMTNYTELDIFSGDLKTDQKNKNAFTKLQEKYPNSVFIYKHFYDKDDNNILMSKIAESDEVFNLENTFKYEYPRTIFYFDDLTEEELRSKELSHLFKTNRHSGILNILCIHNMKHVPPTVREQTNILLLFKGMSSDEIDNIYKWVSPFIKKDVFVRVYRKAVEKEKDFLMCDLDSKTFRRNLGEEIVVE